MGFSLKNQIKQTSFPFFVKNTGTTGCTGSSLRLPLKFIPHPIRSPAAHGGPNGLPWESDLKILNEKTRRDNALGLLSNSIAFTVSLKAYIVVRLLKCQFSSKYLCTNCIRKSSTLDTHYVGRSRASLICVSHDAVYYPSTAISNIILIIICAEPARTTVCHP